MLTLLLPVTCICVNFSTVYNDTLVAKGLNKSSQLDYISSFLLRSCVDMFSIFKPILHSGNFSNQIHTSGTHLAFSGLPKSNLSNLSHNLYTIGKLVKHLAIAGLFLHIFVLLRFNLMKPGLCSGSTSSCSFYLTDCSLFIGTFVSNLKKISRILFVHDFF